MLAATIESHGRTSHIPEIAETILKSWNKLIVKETKSIAPSPLYQRLILKGLKFHQLQLKLISADIEFDRFETGEFYL